MKKVLFFALPLIFLGCGSMMTKMVKSDPKAVETYYVKQLQGEIGCMAAEISVITADQSTGMCGSVDTMKVKCKTKEYICTMSSTINGSYTHAGITQSANCRLESKCKNI